MGRNEKFLEVVRTSGVLGRVTRSKFVRLARSGLGLPPLRETKGEQVRPRLPSWRAWEGPNYKGPD